MKLSTAIRTTRENIKKHDLAARKNIVESYFKASQGNSPPGIPKDTGFLRSKETPSLGSPTSEVPQDPKKGESFQRQNLAIVRSIASKWKLGVTFFFSNLVRYAGIIARPRRGKVGSSQNPRGYHRTLDEKVKESHSNFQWKGSR